MSYGLALAACLSLMTLHGQKQTKAAFGNWGIETQNVSKTVKPGDDFFTYVNEGWLKSTKIPDGAWDYGQTSILGDDNNRKVRETVYSAVESPAPPGVPRRQIGDLYRSFMDMARIEVLGLNPIRSDLHSILNIKTYEDAARWMRTRDLVHLS